MSSGTDGSSTNPGHVMASAVDAEIVKFRALQQELQVTRRDLGTVMGQETENEMVLLELEQMHHHHHHRTEGGGEGGKEDEDEIKVYKLLGPVLVPQDLEESIQTVKKRLEFIQSEKQRLENKIKDTEQRGNTLAQRIQQMQHGLQQSTAEAVRAIAQQHKQ